jgi:hypothetical protein
MNSKVFPLSLMLIVSFLLSVNCNKLETEKRVEKLETKVEFNPIKEHRGMDDARIEVYIDSNIGQPSARLNFKISDVADSRDLVYQGENFYSCTIPYQKKGMVVGYNLEITTATGTKIFFPKNAEEGELYTLVFKGEYSKPLFLLHIILTIVSILLFVVAAYFAFKYIKSGVPISKTVWLSLAAFLLFFIGIFPIGMIVEYQVYGTFWNGWPLGNDFSNTKALILFVYWLVVLFLMKNSIFKKEAKNLIADRIFASLVIIGTIITVALFIIPHENVKF